MNVKRKGNLLLNADKENLMKDVCSKCGTFITKIKEPYIHWVCDCSDTLEPRKHILKHNIKKEN